MPEGLNKPVLFRMTQSEYEGIAARAAFYNVPVSELIRQSIRAGLPVVLEEYRRQDLEAKAFRSYPAKEES